MDESYYGFLNKCFTVNTKIKFEDNKLISIDTLYGYANDVSTAADRQIVLDYNCYMKLYDIDKTIVDKPTNIVEDLPNE